MRFIWTCAAIGLLAAAVGGEGAGEGAMPEKRNEERSQVAVEHVRLTVDRPFDAVAAAFERGLGRHDPGPTATLAQGADPATVRAAIEKMAGPSGFMLFGKNDHGTLLGLVGPRRKAVQYVVGNPLFAVEMTRHAVGAALYAPLRVLIHEPEAGVTCIEYDLPSSLFGQFQDDAVSKVAASLDAKLAALIDDSVK
ncbi:DUF302 domain-containing protein [Paludisphaera mucosa]|uniref:DUF302 domain-containing protein n=1 Tax=Paludisphaera mucosa TaxID=3030827 RepID=A0ABT6FAM0_9BACT|nr:DUF302 domain-containing protein [Paludisphaera mucosa]MDG3004629.1 DUF302 domain-containing protein [Paludisphaera mucosa]